MEDIDKSVMELLVQKQPIGTWPLVGFWKWHKDEGYDTGRTMAETV
jgi:hypothetical protein